MSDRWNVALWGLAAGIMTAASVFGLVAEGLRSADGPGDVALVGAGALAGAVLVVLVHDVLEATDVDPRTYEEADVRKLLLILGLLTVHSFPEGVAIGVSFAGLGLASSDAVTVLGIPVPLLAAFMTVAISVHNVPEGVAISIPLRAMGVGEWRMVRWSVFSSLPQPVGAALAYVFVRIAREALPLGCGFAAGAMVYLVLTEFIPEAREAGRSLPGGGRTQLAGGFLAGVLLMTPLAMV